MLFNKDNLSLEWTPIDVLEISPDFAPGEIQAGNTSPTWKLKPKKTWEITSSYCGLATNLPRSRVAEEYPLRPIHLIDEDPDSYWSDAGWRLPDQGGTWIRIDLATETEISSVAIVSVADGKCMPEAMRIEVSCDSVNWQTVAEDHAIPTASERIRKVFEFSPVRAKQVRLVVLRERPTNTFVILLELFCQLAEVEVLTPAGRNVGAASAGATVATSSTHHYYHGTREQWDWFWPLLFDLGVKWLRVGQWGDRTDWQYVEHEKGKYWVDPTMDAAITQGAERGMKFVAMLGYGNHLYQGDGNLPHPKQGWRLGCMSWPPAPTTPEAIEGFCNYARFMVSHFKGRISHWEIWNEPDIPFWKPEPNIDDFCRLVIAVSKAIRETDPQAQVVLGGTSSLNLDWLRGCLERGIGSHVDIIAHHGYRWWAMPEEPLDQHGHESYADEVAAARKLCQEFKATTEMMDTEINWFCGMPPVESSKLSAEAESKEMMPNLTELNQAKYLARTYFVHAALRIPVTYWSTYTDVPFQEWALFRPGLLTPYPSYYMLRTVSTMLADAEPVEQEVKITRSATTHDGFVAINPGAVETHTFATTQGERLIALWRRVPAEDASPGEVCDVVLADTTAQEIEAIDTLNGRVQKLQVRTEGNTVTIPGLVLRDYPLMLRLRR
jgi:hypothetical protein